MILLGQRWGNTTTTSRPRGPTLLPLKLPANWGLSRCPSLPIAPRIALRRRWRRFESCRGHSLNPPYLLTSVAFDAGQQSPFVDLTRKLPAHRGDTIWHESVGGGPT
jgi:hypothetical protein